MVEIQQGNHDYDNLIQELTRKIKEKRVIVFVGSGFTRGERTTFGKTLPSGNELKEYFISIICQKDDKYKKEHFSESTFADVAEIYFNNVDDDEIKKFFKEHFTNVSLSEFKKKFMSLSWRNIFTLNVDDAIENNTKHNKVIIPYQKYPEDLKDYAPLVYKLHGDILQQILKGENSVHKKIIFSESSYLVSILGENIDMLNEFMSNYRDYHCIFIGCSLKEEQDLKAIIAKDREKIQNIEEIKRVFLTSEKLNPVQLQQYKNYFAINHIIYIKDYDLFYKNIVDYYDGINDVSGQVFFNDYKVSIIENNLKEYIIGKTPFCNEKQICLPSFYIERDLKQEFLNAYDKENVFLLVGKKISGKTYFLIDLYMTIKHKETYYISSDLEIDYKQFQIFLERVENSFIILDSNTFREKHLQYVANNLLYLKKRNIQLIFTFNQSEKMDIAYFMTAFHNKYTALELDNKFSNRELRVLNEKLDRKGLTRYQNKTIVQNLFRFEKLFKIESKGLNLRGEISKIINSENKSVYLGTILLLLTYDKVYSSTFYILYNSPSLFEQFKDDTSYFVEKETTTTFEISKYSGYKLVLICDSCLLYYIEKYITDVGYRDISSEILHIVTKLHPTNQKRLINKLILFDNLNSIFNPKDNRYGGRIIYDTYRKLEEVLYEETDYWLQRATSYLYIGGTDNVKDGIRYALKAYCDFKLDRKKAQSVHTLALLYCRQARLENYQNLDTICEALTYSEEALRENKWNKKYIHKVLKRDQKANDFYKLISKKHFSLPNNYKKKKERLLKIYFEFNRDIN